MDQPIRKAQRECSSNFPDAILVNNSEATGQKMPPLVGKDPNDNGIRLVAAMQQPKESVMALLADGLHTD